MCAGVFVEGRGESTYDYNNRKKFWEKWAKPNLMPELTWTRSAGKSVLPVFLGREGLKNVKNESCQLAYRYFNVRAKLVSKVAKYPQLVRERYLLLLTLILVLSSRKADYRRSVNEYDEKVFFSFKLIVMELRNMYVSESHPQPKTDTLMPTQPPQSKTNTLMPT